MRTSPSFLRRSRAFSLVELIVVLAILSLLAALLFPTLMAVRGKAREIVCVSNLRQIGVGLTMYQQDHDGALPYAISPQDRNTAYAWQPYFPTFANDIPRLPLLHEALGGYVSTSSVFRCPSDTGFSAIDKPYVQLEAAPTSYEVFGTSYLYHSLLSACHASDASINSPSRVPTLYDPVGFWHGTLTPLESRYNMLFADGHVKNLSGSQADEVGGTSISQVSPVEFDVAQVCGF